MTNFVTKPLFTRLKPAITSFSHGSRDHIAVMQCNECLNTIDRKCDRYTVCEGRCAKRYHAACVGITEATMDALFSKNVLWMCDKCLLDFCTTRDANESKTNDVCCSHPTTCEAEIDDLKTKVAGIIETLATMASERKSNGIDTTGKQHSTPDLSPIDRTHLLDGTKEIHTDAFVSGNSSTVPTDLTDCNDTFSLFITNIECHTTERDIERLVCESLSLTDSRNVRVKKLISNKSANNVIDFVSFRVVIPNEFKSLAMQPSTWPKNVKYREFENRIVTWKPNRI